MRNVGPCKYSRPCWVAFEQRGFGNYLQLTTLHHQVLSPKMKKKRILLQKLNIDDHYVIKKLTKVAIRFHT